jgi:hypothetical protein
MKYIVLTIIISFIHTNKVKSLTPANFIKSLNPDEEVEKLKKRVSSVVKDLNISLFNNNYNTADDSSFSISDVILSKFTTDRKEKADDKFKIDENNIYIVKLDQPFDFSFTANFRKSYLTDLLNFDGEINGTIGVDKVTVKETFKSENDRKIKADNVAVYLDKGSLKYTLEGLISKVIDIPKRVDTVFKESLFYVIEGKLNKSINSALAKDKIIYKLG